MLKQIFIIVHIHNIQFIHYLAQENPENENRANSK